MDVVGIHASAETLTFRDSCVDVVMSDQFFEHTRDINLALQEQIRVLAEGGKLIINASEFVEPSDFVQSSYCIPLENEGVVRRVKMAVWQGQNQAGFVWNRLARQG